LGFLNPIIAAAAMALMAVKLSGGLSMHVEELSKEMSISLLIRSRFGRLACVKGPRPYVVPIYYAYHDNYIYSVSTFGQKVGWMRANPFVCLEVDEIKTPQEWSSIVVFGRYEELLDTPNLKPIRDLAYSLLQQRGTWWEPGLARAIIDGSERPLLPLFYRILVEQITGRRASIS
jgi:nitroimidazol reductase NimA-like FMN-containing flavoprotein (pyridoxamine 5'-phosphate oxidase superfamily)